jgi:type IV secretion system protein VirB9
MRRMLIALMFAFPLVGTGASAQTTREVTYSARSIVHVNAKLRFTTMIILPEQEEILDFVCGDKDFWVVSGSQNLAYIKPAKAGATTNLNLVTARGTVYSFLLTEGAADPDLKLYIEPDDTMKGVLGGPPKYYSAAEVDAIKREADDAKRQASDAKNAAAKSAEDAINKFRASYPTDLQFSYVIKGDVKTFRVVAIFHDDRFTYIKTDATELPSLYEIKDNTPNLVNFQVEHGTYVVPKVLESGYLTIGTKKLVFERAK